MQRRTMGTARRKPKYRNIIATGNRAEPKYFGDRMDWIRNKFQPGQMVSVQKQMSEEDDTPEDRKAKRKIWVPYRVVKAYRWHLLLQ
ncbi:MAG: hypothetical protein Q4B01_03975, partial [Eubacteriales bacterium]|nr:hypothetical protein [Eubacteriales bacterium]